MDYCSPRYFINDNGFLQLCPRRNRRSFCSIVTPSFLFAFNTAVTLPIVAGTPTLVPLDENITLRGFTVLPGFTEFTSLNSGIYSSSYDITLNSTTAETVTISIAVNGTQVPGTERTIAIAAGGTVRVFINNFPIRLFSGQIVSLQMTSTTAPATINVTNASLSLNRIANLGPTN